MTHRIGIAALMMLCACSIHDGDSSAPTDPGSDGEHQPTASPDGESLPASARLVAEPVDSVEDVPGRYVQPFALPGQVSVITIGTPDFGMGSYEAYRSCGLPSCIAESGQYNIVPTNPAIGFAAISLVDQTGLVRTTYILDLLWRDADGKLVAVQLRALLGNTTGPTQVWWRLPDAGDTQDDPTARTMNTRPDAAAASAMLAATAAKPTVSGVFVRALPVYGDIGAITIDDAAWSENTASGTFHAAYPYCLPWCLGEDGDYELDLASTTTGTGRLSLIPTGNPSATHEYAVYAIWRTPDGTPAAIQLQRFDGVVPSGPLFTLYRQWWTGDSAAPEPTNAATCSTWSSLAQYYRIRALQCGSSACWALAPWYSSWATYYDGLGEAADCAGGTP